MKIKAKIIADSKNIQGNRITTFILTYPRIIHSELMTHRMFSKNSASSRAIPFEKMVKSVQENPFIPIAWQKDHKGMQGNEYYNNNESKICNQKWLKSSELAIYQAKSMNQAGITKQLCNRLLEPFMWHTVILTATNFTNFFNLRCGLYSIYGCEEEDGQILDFKLRKEVIKYYESKGYSLNKCYIGNNPYTNEVRFKGTIDEMSDLDWLKINKGQSEIHMIALAEAMYDALNESAPKLLKAGEYHIPFEDKIKEQIKTQLYKVNTHLSPNGNYIINYSENDLLKISTVMCARTSYTTVGEDNKEFNYENDIKLYDKLLASGHLSPFEHCAKCMSDEEYIKFYKGIISYSKETTNKEFGWCANFKGFIQYRYLIENKND